MEKVKPRTLSGFMELLPAPQVQMERCLLYTSDIPLHEVQALYDEAAHRFEPGREAPLVPVSMCFTARKDTGAVLSADGVSAMAPVEQAKNRPTTPEMVEKSLRKTGGTCLLYTSRCV